MTEFTIDRLELPAARPYSPEPEHGRAWLAVATIGLESVKLTCRLDTHGDVCCHGAAVSRPLGRRIAGALRKAVLDRLLVDWAPENETPENETEAAPALSLVRARGTNDAA